MKTIYMICILTLMLLLDLSAADNEPIIGFWMNEAGDIKVEIYKSEEKYFGKIVWLNPNGDDLHDTDENNPDPKKKSTKLLGTNVINNLKYDSLKNIFIGGSIYMPKSGKEFELSIKFSDPNTLELIEKSTIFSKKLHWKRIQ